MRRVATVVVLLAAALAAPAARAACPDAGCLGGGGPASTDCAVQWDGIDGLTTSCVDGDSCDLDGQADGVCTFGLRACTGFAGLGCEAVGLAGPPKVAPRKDASAQALAAALGALGSGPGCTEPGFRIALPVSSKGIKATTVKLKVSVASSGGKDVDKLRLACAPAQPRFAAQIEPIFAGACATPACHQGAAPSQNLNLEAGMAHAALVGRPSDLGGKLARVAPGRVKKSFLVRKILGTGIPRFGGGRMPQGCPGLVPCLTDAEVYRIVAWIQAGAIND